MHSITPSIKAMLICDRVITEVGTNKKSLIGIFENIMSSKFPCVHHSLSVYVNFTDALGKYNFKLELVDVEGNKVLNAAEIKDANIVDKLSTNELAFNLQGLSFPHPGKYEFRIYANGKFFGAKSFTIVQMEIKEQGEVV